MKGNAISFKELNKAIALESKVLEKAIKEEDYNGLNYEKTKIQLFIKDKNENGEKLYVFNERVDVGKNKDLKEAIFESIKNAKNIYEKEIEYKQSIFNWAELDKKELKNIEKKLSVYPVIEEKIDKASRESWFIKKK